MRELFLNGSLAVEFWPALEQPTLAEVEDRLGLLRRHRAGGQDAGRHLRRLEPRRLRQTRRNKEAAWKFIQFMTREDVNGAVVDLIPANVKAAEAFLEANRKDPERDPGAAQQRQAAAAVAALPRGLRHPGDLVQDVYCRHGPEGSRGRRPARRSTRCSEAIGAAPRPGDAPGRRRRPARTTAILPDGRR